MNHLIGYRNLEKLQKLRRHKQTTDCLNLIEESSGLTNDEAIFVLNQIGGAE